MNSSAKPKKKFEMFSKSRKDLSKLKLNPDIPVRYQEEPIDHDNQINRKLKTKLSSSFIHRGKIKLNLSHGLETETIKTTNTTSSVQLPYIFTDKSQVPTKLNSSKAVFNFSNNKDKSPNKNNGGIEMNDFYLDKPVEKRKSSKLLENPSYNHFNTQTKTSLSSNKGKIKKFLTVSGSVRKARSIHNSPTVVLKCKDFPEEDGEESVIFEHYELTQAGLNYNGKTKTNQDNYVFLESLFNIKHFDIFGVFDGHGTNGHFVSNFIKISITNFFSKEKHFTKKSEGYDSDEINLTIPSIYKTLTRKNFKIIKTFFDNVEADLLKQKFDIHFSGSTCVLIFRTGNKLICANVGDSRAILVTSNAIEPLSYDHKPNLPKEKERIVSRGGSVKPCDDDEGDDAVMRVWVKGENYPGIAVSRTIGDEVAKSVGVEHSPEIIETTLTGNEQFIVVASDGIWEFLSNDKVKELVMPYYLNNKPNEACEKLIHEASLAWDRDGSARDDITCIVYFFPKK